MTKLYQNLATLPTEKLQRLLHNKKNRNCFFFQLKKERFFAKKYEMMTNGSNNGKEKLYQIGAFGVRQLRPC